MSKPCEVIPCPAEAEYGRSTCFVHRQFILAGTLPNVAKDSLGRGGQKCIVCHKTFLSLDWVYKTLQPRTVVKRSGERFGHQHACCTAK